MANFLSVDRYLQLVLLLLQLLQTAALRLTPDSHVRLPLQDVHVELLAAAQALLHAHRHPGVLSRGRASQLAPQ